MLYLELIIFFIFGVSFGSFYNVLIDRLSTGENITGRSHCDRCHKTLSPIDLIPLISFFILKGKCRYCHKKLSWQYPLIELVTGIAFTGLFYLLSQNILPIPENVNFYTVYTVLVIIFSVLLVIFVADLKYQIIPDQMVVTGIIIGLSKIYIFRENVLSFMVAAIGASVFFLGIFLITRGRGMGFGDVKLSLLLGLLIGFPKIITCIYLAFLTGAGVSIILILGRKKRFGQKIAFGPFLIWGSIIAYFYGDKLIQWYLNFIY